jgi:hypothetical protein
MALELKVSPEETHDVHELAGHELICELRKTSMVLYGMFVELVRKFYRFESPYIIGCPDIKWDPDPQNTGIWIDSELNWNPEHPEFVPAVYVKLGGIEYGSIFGPGAPTPSGMVLKDAIYKRSRIGRTNVTFVHVGGTAGEACTLCDNTRSYLSDFGPVVARDLILTKFYEAQAVPLQPYKPDSKEKWKSSVTYAVEWAEETLLKLESPILRAVDFDALQEHRKYGLLSARKGKPDQHLGEQR